MNRTSSLAFLPAAKTAVSAARKRGGVVVSLALGLGVLGLGTAYADMAPGPPPAECVGKPDGTLCVMDNGTAGKCTTGQWGRQAGRTWVHCEADKNECDRLEIGAVCHGYLGKVAHCKEFTNAEKKTWRTCQVDGGDAPAADRPALAPTPTTAPEPTPPPTSDDTPAGPAPKKGLLSCTAVPGAPFAGGTSVMALWAAALWLSARRRMKSPF